MTGRRRTIWVAIVVAAVALLAVAALDQGGAETDAERIQRLSASFACPQCDGESVAESNAGVSVTIRSYIAEQVAADATDTEIRDALIRAYGAQVLLNPPAGGLASLLWILPVGLVVAGAAGITAAVNRDHHPHAPAAVDTRSPGPEPGRDRTRTLVLVGAGAVFVVGAGLALGQASGERGLNDQLTGSIDTSTRNQVAQCQQMGAGGQDLLGALQCFDEILATDPDHPEALAYRGWYLILAAGSVESSAGSEAGEPPPEAAELQAAGLEYLNRAIEADPTYPDPLAFRAIVHDRQGQPELVCADVETLLALDPPEFFVSQTAAMAARNDC